MKTSKLKKGLVLLTIASGVLAGCELIVDFDRSTIPADGVDATVPDAAGEASAPPSEAGADAAVEADATMPFDGGEDAGDAEASDAEADADAS